MLRAVEKPVWERRADESENEFLAFVTWLHGEQPRAAPTNAFATGFDWGGRARAFDKATSAPRTSKARLGNAVRALITVAELEAEKLARDVGTTEARLLTVKELITLAAYHTGLTQLNDLITDKDQIDTDKLSTDELRKIHDARKYLAKAAR